MRGVRKHVHHAGCAQLVPPFAHEEASVARGNQNDLFSKTQPIEEEPPLDPVRDELGKINPDELSPREALELLYRLKKL